MAIDTARKRASVLGIAFAATLLIPPDGTVEQSDRQTIGLCYSGIAAEIPVVTSPLCVTTFESPIDDSPTLFTSTIDAAVTALESEIVAITAVEGQIEAITALESNIDDITAVTGIIDGSVVALQGKLCIG